MAAYALYNMDDVYFLRADTVPMPENADAARARMHKAIVDEIVNTEADYLADLFTILNVFHVAFVSF